MRYGWDAYCNLCEWRLHGEADTKELANEDARIAMNVHRGAHSNKAIPLMERDPVVWSL